MQGDLVPRRSVETTHYELVFRLGDGSGGAFAFECDERGLVYLGRLPQIARHSLELCLKGEGGWLPGAPGPRPVFHTKFRGARQRAVRVRPAGRPRQRSGQRLRDLRQRV